MAAAFRRLSAADVSNLLLETPAAPMHVGGLLTVEAAPLLDAGGRLDLPRLLIRLERRLSRLPELRRRLFVPGPLGGRPLWVDDPGFRVADHVHERELAAPGGEAELLEEAARLMAPPLDRRRPLWDLWFLSRADAGRVFVLFKLHHAVADGLGIVALLSALLDLDPGAADPPREEWTPEPPPAAAALVVDGVSSKIAATARALAALAHPARLARDAADILEDIGYTARSSRAAPLTSINRPVRPGRRFGRLAVDLAAARQAAARAGGKVNDVVLAVVAGGVRELLLSRGEAVPGGDLVTSVPVSLRPSSAARELGNQAGVIMVPLPVGEPDPRRRLAEVVDRTRRAKARQQAGFGQQVTVAMAALPLARRFMDHQRFVNLFVTNVIGPPVQVYLLGARVEDVMPIVIGAGNVTIAVCALSYAGRLVLAVTADAESCPDVERIVAGMRRTWSELVPTGSARTAG
jgi:diacylglycerol O-acyltransferase / wax synthase